MELRCWLLRDRPLLSGIVTVGVIGSGALLYAASESMAGSILAAAALVISLRRVWLPIYFRLDAQGIVRQVSRQSRRIPWSAVARYEICRRGVVLFPPGTDYRLAAAQGLFIPWAGQRDAILLLLERYGPRM